MNGVIERVIENWLTSANERSYQLSFCQLLAAEGEAVVYVSSHGPLEQGKDVISVNKSGKVRAYQLKCGDINLADWRKHKGEITDLIELPIQHPGIALRRNPECYLVTNGDIKDPAIKAITAANVAWKKRKYPPLQTISKGNLLSRLLSVHGSYLPKELADFTLLLELLLSDGYGPLNKEKVAKMLESVLPIAMPSKMKASELKRVIASSVLLMGYVLQNAYRVRNQWAVFEGWALMGSYLLGIASKYDLPESAWTESLAICETGAEGALHDLCAECESAQTLIQGHPFTDGHFYHARVTILVGLLAALDLYSRLKRPQEERSAYAVKFVREWRFKMKTWGESATPYFALAALASEANGESPAAEQIILNTLATLVQVNGNRGHEFGLPSPYYSAEESLGFAFGLKERPSESFAGSSYTAQPMIDFLTRRWRRQALRGLWHPIARLTMQSFEPGSDLNWFRWRVKDDGVLNSRLLGSPQSWGELLQSASNLNLASLPKHLSDRPAFAIFFSLVYPHRFTRELLFLMESAIKAAD